MSAQPKSGFALVNSRRQWVWEAFLGITALVLAANAIWTSRNVSSLIATMEEIGRSREARNSIDELLSTLKDAETAQRGYLLTRDADYLEPYRMAQGELRPQIAALRQQLGDEPEQLANLSKVDSLVVAKMAELGETMQLVDAGRPEAAIEVLKSGRGLRLMRDLRDVIGAMHQAEGQHQATLVERSDRRFSYTLLTGMFGSLSGVLLVGAAFMLLRRESRIRSLAAETLFAKSEWLNTTLHSIGDAVVVTDANGVIVLLNAVAEDLLGLGAHEASGQPLSQVFDIVDETTRLPVENPVTRAIAESRIVGISNHTVLRSRNGREYVVEDSAAPTFDSAGKVQGAVMVFRDITKRREAQVALSSAAAELAQRAHLAMLHEHTLDTILENAPIGIFVTGAAPDYLIVAMSHQIRDWIGASAENTPAEHAYRKVLADGSLPPLALLPLHRVMEDGAVVQDETWIVECANRPPLRVTVNVAPVRDENGLIVGAVHSWTDLSERERLDRALRITESRLRVLGKSNVIGLVLSFDDRGNVADANDAFLEMFDFDRDDLAAGRINLLAQTPPEYVELDRQAAEQVQGSGYCLPYEKELLRKDGVRRVPVVVGYARVAGPEIENVGFMLDISERRQLEVDLRGQSEKLVLADQRKNEFLATLAHELRNPLVPLRNAITMLESAPRAQRAKIIDDLLDMMSRQIQHLTHMVDDLLDAARIVQNKVHLKRAIHELKPLLCAALDSLKPEIEKRAHRLHLDIEETPVHIDGDATRLNQIVVNIAHNAIKYTPRGGDIRVSLRIDQGEAVVRIRDTGVGIAPDLLPHVFDVFTQADQSLARSSGGLGVGLAMVHRLTELHGGTVKAYSAGRGQGSEFIVRLPLAPAPLSPDPSTEPALQATAVPRRVLVVDDNADVADSTVALLRFWGHEVRVARAGVEAVPAALAFRPDIVLLDIGLPDIDGFEIARQMKSDASLARTRVVALSGYSQAQDRQRSKEAGFDLHIAKPVMPERLRELLRQF